MKNIKAVLTLLLLALSVSTGLAQARLPQIIADSMVLQRNAKMNVWGWASPGEKVTLTFKSKRHKTTTSAEGKWSLETKLQVPFP